jgi:hypothetical protein
MAARWIASLSDFVTVDQDSIVMRAVDLVSVRRQIPRVRPSIAMSGTPIQDDPRPT